MPGIFYLYHDLPVTPINPGSATISAPEKDHPTVPSVAALPNPNPTPNRRPSQSSLPSATLKVLQEAKEMGSH
ncbi:hypothetical protein FOTG_18138, partial [Fusarium oxysporum f. sp. vasinfectum 25433]